MRNLIAIVGNTGVGKSQLAVEIARKLNGEIINSDVMQLYRGLDIITNKHPVSERQGVPHHFMNFLDWNSHYTVQDFESEVPPLIERLHAENKLPILVGGTHYYIQSLLAEEAITAEPGRELSDEEKKLLDNPSEVEKRLHEVDPVVASKFHPNDARRLRRALEIWMQTGKKPSDIWAAQSRQLRYRVLVLWVWCEREELKRRLDARVDYMVEHGLVNEITEMYSRYRPNEAQQGIWQVLGFRQFLPWFELREDEVFQECVERMKADTRQYAKRQSKWIVNKLGPLVNNQMVTLDSTDLQSWDRNVLDKALASCQAFLKGEHVKGTTSDMPEHIRSNRQIPEYSQDKWIRHTCETCSREKGCDVILVGDMAWEEHLKSKGHQKRAKST